MAHKAFSSSLPVMRIRRCRWSHLGAPQNISRNVPNGMKTIRWQTCIICGCHISSCTLYHTRTPKRSVFGRHHKWLILSPNSILNLNPSLNNIKLYENIAKMGNGKWWIRLYEFVKRKTEQYLILILENNFDANNLNGFSFYMRVRPPNF